VIFEESAAEMNLQFRCDLPAEPAQRINRMIPRSVSGRA